MVKSILLPTCLLVLLLVAPVFVEGARMLAVLPFFGASHHRFFHPLLTTLAQAGHEVTVYTPFPLQNPPANYTQVYLDNSLLDLTKVSTLAVDLINMPSWKCIDCLLYYVSANMREVFFKDAKIKTLLESREKFDLIFTEALDAQEFTLVLGHVFQAPVIVLQAYPTNHLVDWVVGNALPLASVPDVCMPYSTDMPLWERMVNSLATIRGLFFYHYDYLPSVDNHVRSYFPDMPPIEEMVSNIALTFTNTHLTLDYPRPLTPNVVHVGGIHIVDDLNLPPKIKKFMDEAPEGVILFSLGTYVPDYLQPADYFAMFIRVFGKLPQRVLWKTMKRDIQGLPDNVITADWLPQQAILAHPNCRLFITHAGYLSSLEALQFGVPLVGIPYLFDQPRNARLYEARGVGVSLDHRDLDEHTVSTAISQVLGDPQFRSNAARLSRMFRDLPVTPARSAVYWTEHVLRHGASHLRPASVQLAFYQRALLDVVAVVVVVIATLCFMIRLLIRVMCRQSRRTERQDGAKKRK